MGREVGTAFGVLGVGVGEDRGSDCRTWVGCLRFFFHTVHVLIPGILNKGVGTSLKSLAFFACASDAVVHCI